MDDALGWRYTIRRWRMGFQIGMTTTSVRQMFTNRLALPERSIQLYMGLFIVPPRSRKPRS